MSITLTKTQSDSVTTDDGQVAWRLVVTALSSDTDEIPSEIFVYHANMGDDPIAGDLFECVASVSQLNEIGLTPVSADDNDGTAIPYYRSDTLTLDFRSPEEMNTAWTKLKQFVEELYTNVKSLASISNETEYVIT